MFDASAAWWDRVQDAIAHPQPKPLGNLLADVPPAPDSLLSVWILCGVILLVCIVGVVLWRRGGSMTSDTRFSIGVSFMTDFVIGAGGALTTAMVATGNTSVPSVAVMIFAMVTGLVSASRRVQAMLEPSPTTTKTVETTPTPSGPKTLTTEVSTAAAVAPVLAAPALPPAPPGQRWEIHNGQPVLVPPTP